MLRAVVEWRKRMLGMRQGGFRRGTDEMCLWTISYCLVGT